MRYPSCRAGTGFQLVSRNSVLRRMLIEIQHGYKNTDFNQI